MAMLLELIELTKHFRTNWTFRTVRAVDRLTLSVKDGEVFGLIGHNGSGKTTTFKLLVGLLRPTHGVVLWDGVPLEWCQPRGSIGFAPEQPYFYDYLTVRETLNFYGQLYGMKAAQRWQRVNALATELQIDAQDGRADPDAVEGHSAARRGCAGHHAAAPARHPR